MCFIGVEVEQETSVPPPKKNPGSAPELAFSNWFRSCASWGFSLRELSIASEPSKFPECKQMINEAWVVSNHLFIFHWGHEWVLKWWIHKIFLCYATLLCQQSFCQFAKGGAKVLTHGYVGLNNVFFGLKGIKKHWTWQYSACWRMA